MYWNMAVQLQLNMFFLFQKALKKTQVLFTLKDSALLLFDIVGFEYRK